VRIIGGRKRCRKGLKCLGGKWTIYHRHLRKEDFTLLVLGICTSDPDSTSHPISLLWVISTSLTSSTPDPCSPNLTGNRIKNGMRMLRGGTLRT
jgi:hypothetical protein